MSSWSYYRDAYYTRKDAIERADDEMLTDPGIQHALIQIAAMEAYIDSVMEAALDEDDE